MKYLICLGMSLVFAQAAIAQDREGGYIGVAAGSFSYEEEEFIDDSASLFRVVGGFRFNENFGLEGSWGETGDLGESFSEVVPPFGTVTLDVNGDYEVLTVRALGFIPFDKVSLLGGVGYYDAEASVSATASLGGSPPVTVSDSGSESGATLVAGFELNLQRIDIRGELEWFDLDDADASDFTVGVIFHF